MKLKSPRLKLFFLLICFLILLGVLGLGVLIFQRGYFVNLSSKSYIDLSDQGGLSLKVSIDPKDEKIYRQFLANANAQDLRDLKLNLDKETMTNLDKILPQRVNLRFKNSKDLMFSSQRGISLKSSYTGQEYNLATGSARAHFSLRGDKDYSAEITDPAPLLKEATSSGSFYLAPPLQGLFPILDKVATIKISVDNGNISGEVKLK